MERPCWGAFTSTSAPSIRSTLSGGGLTRTGYPRAEAEATFERTFGGSGKIVLFVNGLYQNVYKGGFCDPATNGGPCETTAAGVGYGGRFELGPVHIGLAGHYGQGLGLGYALENSPGAFDDEGNPRKIDGYYAQSQFVLGRFDLFAGWGITRIFLTTLDKAAARRYGPIARTASSSTRWAPTPGWSSTCRPTSTSTWNTSARRRPGGSARSRS